MFARIVKLLRLPETATAPFCPSEVQGSLPIRPEWPSWKKMAAFAGPGLLVSVGYMDPGNWATDIEAGSKYGYSLLFVVALASLAAMWLQWLSMSVGLVSGRDLARLARDEYSPLTAKALWILAEIAIIATDVAEVLGGALAFKLLFGVSLLTGIALTAFDTFIVLGLKGKGFRRIEAIVLGLIATIGVCYIVELWWIKPDWSDVARGFWPGGGELSGPEPWYLAVAILGATVMPHNLYLHSSIVQTRKVVPGRKGMSEALRFATIDTVGSLFLAFLVNAAILILAGAAFRSVAGGVATEIDDAYRLLQPVVGGSWASILFGIALLAAGQSSTFTGTIAGQVMMEGFIDLRMPCWQRRVITRGLALIPAVIGVGVLGDHSTGRILIMSQVALSLQLPFAIYPLVNFASKARLMGEFRIRFPAQAISWLIFIAIAAANLLMAYKLIL